MIKPFGGLFLEALYNAAAWLMKMCYNMCGNYGAAILIFTLLSKLILLPLSIWVLKNSIRLVRIQPDVNAIKIRYFGDREQIAEEQNALYKKEKYRPLISVIPTFAQLIVLMAVIAAIKAGIGDPEINKMFLGIDLGTTYSAGAYTLDSVKDVLDKIKDFIASRQ